VTHTVVVLCPHCNVTGSAPSIKRHVRAKHASAAELVPARSRPDSVPVPPISRDLRELHSTEPFEDLDHVQDWMEQRMDEHGLSNSWYFEWDQRAFSRFGYCDWGKRRLSMSKPLVEANLKHHPEHVRDTGLHEIAHAIAGPAAGHKLAWRKVCVRIGANPRAKYNAMQVIQPMTEAQRRSYDRAVAKYTQMAKQLAPLPDPMHTP
jgi:hypothetical protein